MATMGATVAATAGETCFSRRRRRSSSFRFAWAP
jgi:hypothetical protein